MTPPTIHPSPKTWTLRLKNHKKTVLLHIDPLQSFDSIKETLYAVLAATHTPADPPLPSSSASDLEFGRPLDPKDPHSGFGICEWEDSAREEDGDGDEEEIEVEVEVEGTGRGRGKGKGGRNGEVGECPKGAGLKDGGVLAWRWRGERGWEVDVAVYEDVYGMENQGDLGERGAVDG